MVVVHICQRNVSQCPRYTDLASLLIRIKNLYSNRPTQSQVFIRTTLHNTRTKWVAKFLGYDYEICYKPGQKNSIADALSREVGSPSLDALFAPQVELWKKNKKKMTVRHSYMERICKMTMGWFSTKIEWLFLKIPTSFLNSYGSFMIPILVGILNYCEHTRD